MSCVTAVGQTHLKILERRLALSKLPACTSSQGRMQEAMQHLNCSGTMYCVRVARFGA
jgi:hypothetical protein